MGSNARLGKSHYLVAEADESDRSFLKLSPILAVVTNIDREHMDCYRNMRDVKRAFRDFMDRVPFYGMVVVCNDDPLLRRMLPQIQRRTVTYGTRRGSDFHIKLGESLLGPGANRPISRFYVTFQQKALGEFRVHVPGAHNVLNATAAIAVGIGLDISIEQVRAALENFRGVDRRFQFRGAATGVSVIDDYGHHPTEVRATLSAARQCGFLKIHVVFQPHRYTRTQLLMDEFAKAFHDADTLFILDIYAASEPPIEGITGEALARHIREAGKQEARYAVSFADAARAVVAGAQEGDMILTLGAGSVSQLAPMIFEELQARQGIAGLPESPATTLHSE
jgi:UDP-N-acetylmuramate--alanine ligase